MYCLASSALPAASRSSHATPPLGTRFQLRSFKSKTLTLVLTLLLAHTSASAAAATLKLNHSVSGKQLERFAQAVISKRQPETATFASMQKYHCASYKNSAVERLYAQTDNDFACKNADGGPATPEHCVGNLKRDNIAAWSCAIQGYVNNDPASYEASAKIIRAWAAKFKGMIGSALYTSILWHTMIWAADLLEAAYPGFTATDRAAFRTMLRAAVLPIVSRKLILNNWESFRVHALYNVGIYLRDNAIVDRAYDDTLAQIQHYIGKGYSFEVHRDMWHAQMGIGPLAMAAEIAYHRGDGGKLYRASNNAILRASEHAAHIVVNLSDGDADPVSGEKNLKQINGRGPRPPYQVVVHHYGDRLGLKVDKSRAAVASNRAKTYYSGGVEHYEPYFGWGTAFYRGADSIGGPGEEAIPGAPAELSVK